MIQKCINFTKMLLVEKVIFLCCFEFCLILLLNSELYLQFLVINYSNIMELLERLLVGGL